MKSIKLNSGFGPLDKKVAVNDLLAAFEAGVNNKIEQWNAEADQGNNPDFKEPLCELPIPQDLLTVDEAVAALSKAIVEAEVMDGPDVGIELVVVPDYKDPNGPQADIYRKGYAPSATA